MNENTKFPSFKLNKRINSMINVDLRRLFSMPLYYLMVGISLVIPILILVMTTMFGEGEEAMGTFSNVWSIIGSTSNMNSSTTVEMTGDIDMLAMCNMDMMFFAIAVLVCIFINQDFKSGYVKHLFTVRSSKTDYVISKTLIGFIGGVSMLLAFFVGSIIGGKIASLSFELPVGVTPLNIVMSLLTKFSLVCVFVPIFLLASVIGKEKLWLSMILSFGISMLLFTMVSMIAPLNATIINVVITIVGALVFTIGLGCISNIILKKNSLI